MLKKVVNILSLSILALLIAIGSFLGLSINAAYSVNTNGILPVLSTEITSPSDGAVIQVGQCFEVTAKIQVICPTPAEESDASRFKGSPFVKPAYASTINPIVCVAAAFNTKATIDIQGNAAVQGEATKDALTEDGIPTLFCQNESGQCLDTATVSWQVCCTGPGTVTITVTPSGDSDGFVASNGIFDGLVSPVSAGAAPPLPEDHLFSDSITIHQLLILQPPDVLDKPFADEGGNTWSMPQQAPAKPAYTKVLTASVQPSQVVAGQAVKIMANVSNSGDISGSYTAELSINGQVESSKKLSVPGNASLPVEFTVVKDKPGTYTIDVGGQKAYFTVVGAAKGVSSTTIIYTVLGLLVLLAVALGIIYAMRKGFSK